LQSAPEIASLPEAPLCGLVEPLSDSGGRHRIVPLSRKLLIWMTSLAAVAGIAAIPAVQPASADSCTITVITTTGQKLTFVVDVPPGTPLSSISLPVHVPVASISESCQSSGSGSGTGSGSGSGSSSTGTTTTSTPTSTSPSGSKSGGRGSSHPSKGSKPGNPHSGGSKRSNGHGHSTTGSAHHAGGSSHGSPAKPVKRRTTGPGGVPTAANPTVSFALPGPAPLGVPNFFIDSFQIPPFLLPIYQAAGIEYNVPWQVLAAINEIETDYGRNLSVSSAGAVGWMQFLPSTWKRWGVAATGNGIADPYNPVDAIFTAARYLQAAGAARNLPAAIYAYNHAGWYVQSVLLRAKLIGGMPQQLIGALTGLVEGHFPVAAKATYADSGVLKLAHERVSAGNPAEAVASDQATGTSIYSRAGAPVIAVNDGRILRLGHNARLGDYVVLQDETGNVYTYSNLGSIPKLYPVPKPVRFDAIQIARELADSGVPSPRPAQPATAGTQQAPAQHPALRGKGAITVSVLPPASAGTQTSGAGTRASGTRTSTSGARRSSPALAGRSASAGTPAVVAKERLFANPSRPGSYAAGGAQQLSAQQQIQSFQSYFSDVLHLPRDQYTLKPLRAGAVVIAGTILGHLGQGSASSAPHLYFQVRPAGKNSPLIDPKPILDGWKLLEATAVYRAAGIDPFFGPGARNPTIGQMLLESKTQLQETVLHDPHVYSDTCTLRQIQAGTIDRRILAAVEYLSLSGLSPTVQAIPCATQSAGPDQAAAVASGSTIDITQINHIPIAGHQGPGSITDITIRRLLTLQGSMAPSQIISLRSYRSQPSTLSLPDHANRIQIAYTPLYGENHKLTSQLNQLLKPGQWIQLINRISQIPEPSVPTATSPYAIRTNIH
jgi:hypothetical protein